MQQVLCPVNEEARLKALRQYKILDTAAERAFDDITALAASVCRAPIALLTFIDHNRQWIKSSQGVGIRETGRNVSFCAHAICHGDLFIVPDALADDRFADNPMVTGEPGVRFYAGMPLVNPEGYALGALCIIDREPRNLDEQQQNKLRALAESAVMLLEIRRSEQEKS